MNKGSEEWLGFFCVCFFFLHETFAKYLNVFFDTAVGTKAKVKYIHN